MAKHNARAGGFSFANLMGGAHAARAEGDKPEGEDKNKGEKASGAKAEEVDEDGNPITPDPEEGVDEEETPDLGDVKDPDDSIDEDAAPEEDDVDPKVKKAAKSGRKAERGRWAKVMSHSSAAGREAAACQMLANSPMDARTSVATLQTLPKAAAVAPAGHGGLRDRMAAAPAPRLGPDGGKPTGEQTFAEQSAAAMAKVRPARR